MERKRERKQLKTVPGTVISMHHVLVCRDDFEGAVNEFQAASDTVKGHCKTDCTFTSELPSTQCQMAFETHCFTIASCSIIGH